MEIQAVAQKPQPVGIAVNLLWASLGVGLVKTVIDYSHVTAQASVAFTTAVVVFTFALIGFLVFKISAGKNWARITFLILFLIGVLPSLFVVVGEFSRSLILGVLSVAQIGLQGYALFLLFSLPGSNWFRKVVSA